METLELKRSLGLAYLVGMGFLLGGVALQHLSAPGEPFLGKILSLAALLGLAGPLLWSAYWLWSREFTSAHVWRAVGWSVEGMGTLTTLAVITIFYERSHGIYLADASVITLWVAGTGATAGIIVGRYDLQHRLSREEVQRTANRLATLLETAPIPLMELDRDGAVTRWNPAAERTFGWSSEEVRGNRVPIKPAAGDNCDEWNAIINRQEPLTGSETRCETKGGSMIEGRVWATPLRDGDGEVIGTLVVVVDVTDETRRRQQLDVTNRILRHNLRNAVNIILGRAELLNAELSDPDLQSELEAITEATQGLERLSKQAKNLQRALTSDATSRESCDIVTIVERIRDDLQRQYPATAISLTAPETAWVAVDCSIELAIREVIENAINHAGQADSSIDIDVSLSGEQSASGSVELTVADEGPGIPEQERVAIERGEETQLQHGSGLGLWLVKWVLNHNGGTVSITDNQPQGTVVTLTLPVGTPVDDHVPQVEAT